MSTNQENSDQSKPAVSPTVSLWDIERLLLGELSPQEEATVRKEISASTELSAYLERMREVEPARSFQDLKSRIGLPLRKPGKPEGGRSRAFSFVRNWLDFLGGPKPAWAGASVLALVLGGLVIFQGGSSRGKSGLRVKGASDPEVHIVLGKRESGPDQAAFGRAGDTVAVRYRSSRPVHIQVWIRENGKPLEPVSSGPGGDPDWPGSTHWTFGPDKLVLEGDWASQEIFFVASHESFTDGQARNAIANRPKSSGPLMVFSFPIEKSE